MGIKIKSTKTFQNLPCAHSQHHDLTPNGTPGACAAIHGYDREVTFTFAGEIDEYGWIFPFGDLKDVKTFLEYYFDHVTVLPADDPRLDDIPDEMWDFGGLLGTLRILPSGVSMEMSSLFIWEHVNPYIYHRTGGRVYVEKVECREHDRNSAMVEVDEETAKRQARQFNSFYEIKDRMQPVWDYEAPLRALARLEN